MEIRTLWRVVHEKSAFATRFCLAPPAGLEPATTCINPQVAEATCSRVFLRSKRPHFSARKRKSRVRLAAYSRKQTVKYKSSQIQTQHEKPKQKCNLTNHAKGVYIINSARNCISSKRNALYIIIAKATAQLLLKPLYPQKHFFNRRRYLNYFLTPIDISGWISQKFSTKLRLMSS